MKIGILTLTLHTNYGGILQAYALQTVLERMGHEVVVFNTTFKPKQTKWLKVPKRVIKKILGKDIVVFQEQKENREAPIINSKVWKFREKYIHEYLISNFNELGNKEFDCIVVGSDQVWRPIYFEEQWRTRIEDAYLAFTKGWNIRRIVYAASLGVDSWEYSDEKTINCRELINLFDNVSVRESSAISLVRDYLGITVSQVIDPTFLLSSSDYLQLAKKELGENYYQGELLVYFLNPNSEKKELIEKVARQKGLKPFYVNNRMQDIKSPIKDRVLPSVEEWLYGFHNAKFVLTDSFHACVFSIIFQKPFVAFSNMERGTTRFTSLLRGLGLDKNLICTAACYDEDNSYGIENENILLLSSLIDKSMMFLRNSLCSNSKKN